MYCIIFCFFVLSFVYFIIINVIILVVDILSYYWGLYLYWFLLVDILVIGWNNIIILDWIISYRCLLSGICYSRLKVVMIKGKY